MLPSVFQIAIVAAKPDDLTFVAFWGTQAGLGVPAVLAIGISVAFVQNGHDTVHDIERQIGKALELFARDRMGGGQSLTAVGREWDDLAHGMGLSSCWDEVVRRQARPVRDAGVREEGGAAGSGPLTLGARLG